MKLKTLLLFVLISIVPVMQKATYAQEFPYGVWLNDNDSLRDTIYSSAHALGMNYLVQYARAGSDAIKSKLSSYNLIAVKEDTATDYIGHYSRGYYGGLLNFTCFIQKS